MRKKVGTRKQEIALLALVGIVVKCIPVQLCRKYVSYFLEGFGRPLLSIGYLQLVGISFSPCSSVLAMFVSSCSLFCSNVRLRYLFLRFMSCATLVMS